MTLSTPQIVAQLDRILSSDATILALAIHSPTRQTWPDTLSQRGRQFALRWCESSLAIREALCDVEQHEAATAGLVVLTPLLTRDLADDVAARLARARVYQPEGWEIVRQLFEAKETDARLGRFAWMPQCLIDGATQGAYAPVANGFLDLETAWREVLQRTLRLGSARPDAVALLQWSLTPGADTALVHLPAITRGDVTRWLGESSGTVGALVLACVEAGRTADAVALGLVCGVVYPADGEEHTALGQAAIRLERFVGDKHVGRVEGRAWAQAAEQVVRAAGPESMRGVLERADVLLNELRVSDFAHLSDVLPTGLDQRMRGFSVALSTQVSTPSGASLAAVEDLANSVLKHFLGSPQQRRMDRVEMARRLSRWLMTAVPSAATVATAAEWQTEDGAFVDWARFRLLGGDELPELDHAYSAVRTAVIDRRNVFAKAFSQALVQWNADMPGSSARVIPVENVLSRVVAPIAVDHAVLLLVMDGLSTSIFRELFARLEGLGWDEVVSSQTGRPLAGLAALPTITEVSRASLLCGRLTTGGSAQEKSAFTSHAALLASSRSASPPRLFHKGDLADATNLSADVRAALSNAQQRVVGIVYNAVDDHLSGPDQLNQRWALEDLRLLLPLLREAREARRVVIVTADHGHLLEDGTLQVAATTATDKLSDRWRIGRDARDPHEVALAGGRVVTADGSREIVCLWGESTRYTGRKNGYHGGISPQEVTVPLSVLVPLGMKIQGWQPAPPAQPEWWELPHLPPLAPLKDSHVLTARQVERQAAVPAAQPSLFDAEITAPAPTSNSGDWISALLASPVYSSQRQLAARVALSDDKMRLLLVSLSERGGKLSKAALAQRLALPEMRLGGLLSAVRRMLNVDQALVLVVDESTGTIVLNRALLLQQFRIELNGGRR